MTTDKLNILFYLNQNPNSPISRVKSALQLDNCDIEKEFQSLTSMKFIEQTESSGDNLLFSVFNNFTSIILEDGTFIPLKPLFLNELERDRKRINNILDNTKR